MHELSIAQSIVEIVSQYVTQEEQERVRTITVRIGAMAGVVPDSLEFCFAAVVHHTPLAHAAMAIEHVPFVVSCHTCEQTAGAEPGIALCPQCGSADTEVLSGTELQVVSIDVDEATAGVP
jgi:hydrogenase nickel incorporation protein HypA/HybF